MCTKCFQSVFRLVCKMMARQSIDVRPKSDVLKLKLLQWKLIGS